MTGLRAVRTLRSAASDDHPWYVLQEVILPDEPIERGQCLADYFVPEPQCGQSDEVSHSFERSSEGQRSPTAPAAPQTPGRHFRRAYHICR